MSQTGEQPVAKEETPLSENTPMRVGLVIVLATALCTAAVAVYQVGELKDENRTQAAEIRATERDIADLKTQRAVAAKELETLSKSFDGLSKELREFMAEMRGTRSANFRQPRGPNQ